MAAPVTASVPPGPRVTDIELTCHLAVMALRDEDIAALEALVVDRIGAKSSAWWALERGLASERPLRDGLTQVWAPLALRRGHLLRLPVQDSAVIPAATCCVHGVAIDVVGLVWMNDHHGFGPTDAALVRLARALVARFPERHVVRVHGDAFAAISSLAPVDEHPPGLGEAALAALGAAMVQELHGPDRLTPVPERVTTVEVELQIAGLRDSELFGTLVHAEIEAALGARRSRRRAYDFR